MTMGQKHVQMGTRLCMEIRSLGSAKQALRRGRQYQARLGSSCVGIADVTRHRIGFGLFEKRSSVRVFFGKRNGMWSGNQQTDSLVGGFDLLSRDLLEKAY